MRCAIFKKAVLVLFLLIWCFRNLDAQPVSVAMDSLTMEKAVELALKYHPSLRAAEANVNESSATLRLSKAGYFPALSFTASTTRTEGAFVFNPSFPARVQKFNNYATGFQLQQTIYDFGKTGGHVSANKNLLQASSFSYQNARNTVITNVQLAYLSFVQAKDVIKVNEETLKQADQHLIQAKAFYAVGTNPRFDVIKAEVDLANAKVNLLQAQNQEKLARVQLENAMGVHVTTNYEVADGFTIRPFILALDSAKAIALSMRPDLRAARVQVSASHSLVSAAWSQHLPTLSLDGNYTWSGFNFPLQSRWNLGVTLSFPLFEGLGLYAQVQQARANVDAAQASVNLLVQQVLQQVEEYYLNLREAEERMLATQTLVQEANESLRLANARYKSGVGSALEITDALVTVFNAHLTDIQAKFDYNSSLVQLYQAMGIIARQNQ